MSIQWRGVVPDKLCFYANEFAPPIAVKELLGEWIQQGPHDARDRIGTSSLHFVEQAFTPQRDFSSVLIEYRLQQTILVATVIVRGILVALPGRIVDLGQRHTFDPTIGEKPFRRLPQPSARRCPLRSQYIVLAKL